MLLEQLPLYWESLQQDRGTWMQIPFGSKSIIRVGHGRWVIWPNLQQVFQLIPKDSELYAGQSGSSTPNSFLYGLGLFLGNFHLEIGTDFPKTVATELEHQVMVSTGWSDGWWPWHDCKLTVFTLKYKGRTHHWEYVIPTLSSIITFLLLYYYQNSSKCTCGLSDRCRADVQCVCNRAESSCVSVHSVSHLPVWRIWWFHTNYRTYRLNIILLLWSHPDKKYFV